MEHALTISYLVIALACCPAIGKRIRIQSFGAALLASLPLTFVVFFIFSCLVPAAKEFLHMKIFYGGDNDWVYLYYFISFPLFSAIAMWIGRDHIN